MTETLAAASNVNVTSPLPPSKAFTLSPVISRSSPVIRSRSVAASGERMPTRFAEPDQPRCPTAKPSNSMARAAAGDSGDSIELFFAIDPDGYTDSLHDFFSQLFLTVADILVS